jgi:uncharacterized protein (TIGR04255 family)
MAEPLENKSPLTDRVIGVHFSKATNEEDFLVRIPAFADHFKRTFPIEESQAEWKVALEPNEFGIPIVSEEKSRLLKIFRWWESNSTSRMGLLMRPDYFGVHYSRSAPGAFADFNETFDLLERTLPDFMRIFGKHQFTGCSIEYVNRINNLFTPQFAKGKVLDLSLAIRMFALLPKPEFVSIVPPFSFGANLLYDKTVPYRVRVHFIAEPKGESSDGAFQVRIRGHSVKAQKQIEWKQAADEIHKLHDCTHKQFRWTFTDSALTSFGIK